jgi:hypothetical protein
MPEKQKAFIKPSIIGPLNMVKNYVALNRNGTVLDCKRNMTGCSAAGNDNIHFFTNRFHGNDLSGPTKGPIDPEFRALVRPTQCPIHIGGNIPPAQLQILICLSSNRQSNRSSEAFDKTFQAIDPDSD